MTERVAVREVADLRDRLHGAVSRFVPTGSTVALLDFPSYPNVGDSAIWLGTVAELRRLGCRIAYVCDQRSYSREALARRLPAGSPILLQGGGNFGDLWPEHQLFRERVLEDFPDRVVVQLPVSIAFRDPDAERRAESALARHERVTLLCRDEASAAYAAERYARAAVELCPDGAFGLSPRRRPRPRHEVTMLLRSDAEGLERVPRLPGAWTLDWASDWGQPGYNPLWERGRRLSQSLGAATGDGRGVDRLRHAAIRALFAAMVRWRVRFGYEVVGSGRVLVTDRLHGHILALLLGVPHVLIETGFGKVRGFYEAFSRGVEGAVLCDDPAQLEGLVAGLLGR
jgi:pyruvyl transferase EpsO